MIQRASLIVVLCCAPLLAQAQPQTEALTIYTQLLGSKAKAEALVSALTDFSSAYHVRSDVVFEVATPLVNLGVTPTDIPRVLLASLDAALGAQATETARANAFLAIAGALGEMLAMREPSTPHVQLLRLDAVGVRAFEIVADELGVTPDEVRRHPIRSALRGPETAGWILQACQKKYGGLAKKLAESRKPE